jgi:acetylornithine deacetylase
VKRAPAQRHLAASLRNLGAEVSLFEPDIAALFARYPSIAQYPTHWRHDLILPYAELPTYEALRASGLENVLNYRDRPNVIGVFRGSGGGRSLILNGRIDTVTIEPAGEWARDPFGAAIENGLMYGRGTSDMKGGLMAALMALTFLKRAGVVLRSDRLEFDFGALDDLDQGLPAAFDGEVSEVAVELIAPLV